LDCCKCIYPLCPLKSRDTIGRAFMRPPLLEGMAGVYFYSWTNIPIRSNLLEKESMQSVQDLAIAVQRVVGNVEKVIMGKAEPVAFSLIAVICRGHVLIEDVPGVGKTVLTKAIARSIGCTFKRIQFTPDLLPSDVTG